MANEKINVTDEMVERIIEKVDESGILNEYDGALNELLWRDILEYTLQQPRIPAERHFKRSTRI